PRLDELVEDPADRRDLVVRTRRERHPLVLDSLFLVVLEYVKGLAGLVEQQAGVAIGRTSPDPVALLGDLDAAVRDLGAQFLAELRGAKTLELHVNGVERVVRAGHPQRRVDDLLPVSFALGTV